MPLSLSVEAVTRRCRKRVPLTPRLQPDRDGISSRATQLGKPSKTVNPGLTLH